MFMPFFCPAQLLKVLFVQFTGGTGLFWGLGLFLWHSKEPIFIFSSHTYFNECAVNRRLEWNRWVWTGNRVSLDFSAHASQVKENFFATIPGSQAWFLFLCGKPPAWAWLGKRCWSPSRTWRLKTDRTARPSSAAPRLLRRRWSSRRRSGRASRSGTRTGTRRKGRVEIRLRRTGRPAGCARPPSTSSWFSPPRSGETWGCWGGGPRRERGPGRESCAPRCKARTGGHRRASWGGCSCPRRLFRRRLRHKGHSDRSDFAWQLQGSPEMKIDTKAACNEFLHPQIQLSKKIDISDNWGAARQFQQPEPKSYQVEIGHYGAWIVRH